MDEAKLAAAEAYFSTSEQAPADLHKHDAALAHFMEEQATLGRPVVCVTAGGTTVPLELNTVRSIDNFSTGRRGSISAEQFLSLGYAVIYLHRRGCAAPYARTLAALIAPHVDLQLMEALTVNEQRRLELTTKDMAGGEVTTNEKLLEAALSYQAAAADQALLAIPFT
jgi:phosphopantothenate---cysteine ligase (ATP)